MPGPAPHDVLRRRAGLVDVALDGEVLVVDEQAAGLHHLDPVATSVWRLLDGTRSLAQVAEHLAEAYGTQLATVLPDVTRLVEALLRDGLLEPVAG